MKPSTRRKLVFSAVALVLGLGLLEGVCRLAELLVAQPLAKPWAAQVDRVPPKRPGELRVFVYGASTVRGHRQVPQLSLLPQLGHWLRKGFPDRNARVYGFGVGSLSSWRVRRMLAETFHLAPDVAVVMTGHNEFLLPEVEGGTDVPLEVLRWSATGRVIAHLLGRARTWRRKRRQVSGMLPSFDPRSQVVRDKRAAYRRNIDAIVHQARSAGVRLVLCTMAANVAEQPPIDWALKEPRGGIRLEPLFSRKRPWDAAAAEAQAILARQGDNAVAACVIAEAAHAASRPDTARQVERARMLAAKWLARQPDDALALFLLGRAALLAGRYDEARSRLLQAKDLDPYPLRVLEEFNEHVRSKATEAGVTVVDVDRALRDRSPHGLLGFNLMIDNCHPTPEGYALMARGILAGMCEAGLLGEAASLSPEAGRLEPYLRALAAQGLDAQQLVRDYFDKPF